MNEKEMYELKEKLEQELVEGITIEDKVREAGFVPEGLCSKCNAWHTLNSEIGKAHREFLIIIGGRTK